MTAETSTRTPLGAWYLAAAAVFAVAMAGTTLPTPLYGLYQQELGFSELTTTVVFAVYAGGVILALLLAGGWSDVVGRRPVLLAGLGCAALSAVCFLGEHGLPLLFAGRVLSGLCAGLFSGAATAAILDLAPPGRQARAGLAATAANMGGLGCGPLLSGVLAEYAPAPLTLPYAVHLALVGAAAVVVVLLPETVRRERRRPPLRGQGVRVPAAVRPVFLPAALAAFAGFSVFGLFTAVAPRFLSQTLNVRDLALAGAVVFAMFCASVGGQALSGRMAASRALPYGCGALVAGVAMVGGSLAAASTVLLVLGAVTVGLGQGLSFRAGLTAVGAAAPAGGRGAVISGYFVVAYLGISLPVVGVGTLAEATDLTTSGMVFTGCVMLLAGAVGTALVVRPLRDADGN